MKFGIETHTYKDKWLLLPLDEFAWQPSTKIFSIKFGFLKWTVTFKFNF